MPPDRRKSAADVRLEVAAEAFPDELAIRGSGPSTIRK
jgi:hypothetical protein